MTVFLLHSSRLALAVSDSHCAIIRSCSIDCRSRFIYAEMSKGPNMVLTINHGYLFCPTRFVSCDESCA